jgi:hypothetical protein
VILCPKSNELVDAEQCTAIKNLSKTMAEYFSIKICKTVTGCPKEEYCTIFKCGWESVENFIHTL